MANFVGLSDAGDRLVGFNLSAALFVLPKILTEVGLDQAGGDGVDANAVLAKFASPTASHHDQARLREAVKQTFGLGMQTRDRRDVNDRSARLPLDHFWDGQPH